MVFRVSIGEITCLLDDEMTDERPTPERARDYLRICGNEVLRVYSKLDADTDDEDTDTSGLNIETIAPDPEA